MIADGVGGAAAESSPGGTDGRTVVRRPQAPEGRLAER
jgi:hypothetical protein